MSDGLSRLAQTARPLLAFRRVLVSLFLSKTVFDRVPTPYRCYSPGCRGARCTGKSGAPRSWPVATPVASRTYSSCMGQYADRSSAVAFITWAAPGPTTRNQDPFFCPSRVRACVVVDAFPGCLAHISAEDAQGLRPATGGYGSGHLTAPSGVPGNTRITFTDWKVACRRPLLAPNGSGYGFPVKTVADFFDNASSTERWEAAPTFSRVARERWTCRRPKSPQTRPQPSCDRRPKPAHRPRRNPLPAR